MRKNTNTSIIKTLENDFDLKVGSILSTKKSNKILAARQIAMYLSKELLNYSYSDIATIYSKDITANIIAEKANIINNSIAPASATDAKFLK